MSNKRNEFINQLLSDLKLLEERLLSVKESDTLPFSFFSTSFNSVERIARSLHELELMQIGEMKEQMERLVRFLSESDSRNTIEKESAPQVVIQSEESIQSKQPEQKEQIQYTVEKELNHQPSHTVYANNPVQTNFSRQYAMEKGEINKEQEISHISDKLVFPEYKDPRISNPVATQSLKVIVENTSTEKIETDKAATRSLNDVIQAPPAILDLKRGFSLNDRFLFQRELFNNNRTEMNDLMEKLNKMGDFNEVENYLINALHWDVENKTVKEFLNIVKKGFE